MFLKSYQNKKPLNGNIYVWSHMASLSCLLPDRPTSLIVLALNRQLKALHINGERRADSGQLFWLWIKVRSEAGNSLKSSENKRAGLFLKMCGLFDFRLSIKSVQGLGCGDCRYSCDAWCPPHHLASPLSSTPAGSLSLWISAWAKLVCNLFR